MKYRLLYAWIQLWTRLKFSFFPFLPSRHPWKPGTVLFLQQIYQEGMPSTGLSPSLDGGVETAVSPVLVSAISKPDWRVAGEKIVNRVGARYGKDELQRRWIRPAPHPLALITVPKTKK